MEPWLRRRARLTPDAPALTFAGATSTFAALDVAADRLARRLAAHGIGPGDRVVLLAAPTPPAVHAVHAVQCLGAILVPINPRSTAHELGELATMVRPTVVLHDRTTVSLVAGLPALDIEQAPPSDASGGSPDIGSRGCDERELGSGSDADRSAYAPPRCGPELDATATHSMLLTSGTTGRPKAACLTHAQHAASAHASARHLGIGAHDRWLLCMPLCHVGGLAVVLRSAITGFAVELHPRFDADAVNRAILDAGVTIVSVVPTMLARMLDALRARAYPPTLRIVLTGGGPLPPALHARARAARVPVVPTYGLTEAASQVATGRPDGVAGSSASSAVVLPGTEIRVREPDATGIGEILVRGPTVMAGYFEDEAASQAALRGGWLHTGDAGRLHADGTLAVIGRRADLIVSGGENVYPAEVERVLAGHPDVDEVAVYGVPDDEWGEGVVAAVVSSRADLTVEDLRAWGAARLAGYKLPRALRRVTALPRTATGKLQRALLRAGEVSAA